jgi:CO/xanthine dehydrogenase FAD-binding subunit
LVALGAQLRLVPDEGDRVVPVEDFYLNDGIRNLALEPGEIVTEVLLPQATGAGAFFKFRPQNNLDYATFTLSVLLSGNGRGARIVVGSVASRPLRAREAEKMLDAETWEASDVSRKAASEVKLVSFVRGSVDFKKQVIEAYLSRILERLKRSAN